MEIISRRDFANQDAIEILESQIRLLKEREEKVSFLIAVIDDKDVVIETANIESVPEVIGILEYTKLVLFAESE